MHRRKKIKKNFRNKLLSSILVHPGSRVRSSLCLFTVVDRLEGCARFASSSCSLALWTAGQRLDLSRRRSPFVWKQTPGTGSCCGGTCMAEMRYTNWGGNGAEPDADQLGPTSACVQLCSGTDYAWRTGDCESPSCAVCEVDL